MPQLQKPSALRRIREDRGFSQTELAEKVRTSQPQIDRLEKGQRKLTKPWALRLAVPLECHWLELLDESPPLSQQEEKLVELYRGLSDGDRATVFRIADAMATTHTAPVSSRKR